MLPPARGPRHTEVVLLGESEVGQAAVLGVEWEADVVEEEDWAQGVEIMT